MAERAAGAIEVMVFEVDGRRFGLARTEVIDVLRVVSLVPLPIRVNRMLEFGGAFVPVFNVRAEDEPHPATPGGERVIVARYGARRVALRADGPVYLTRISAAALEKARRDAIESGIVPGAAELADRITYIHDLRTFLTHAERAVAFGAHRLRRSAPTA
jgi:chemotaxis signal transduction protein